MARGKLRPFEEQVQELSASIAHKASHFTDNIEDRAYLLETVIVRPVGQAQPRAHANPDIVAVGFSCGEHTGAALQYDIQSKVNGRTTLKDYFGKHLAPILDSYEFTMDHHDIGMRIAHLMHESMQLNNPAVQGMLNDLGKVLQLTNRPVCKTDLSANAKLVVCPTYTPGSSLWVFSAPDVDGLYTPAKLAAHKRGEKTFAGAAQQVIITSLAERSYGGV